MQGYELPRKIISKLSHRLCCLSPLLSWSLPQPMPYPSVADCASACNLLVTNKRCHALSPLNIQGPDTFERLWQEISRSKGELTEYPTLKETCF